MQEVTMQGRKCVQLCLAAIWFLQLCSVVQMTCSSREMEVEQLQELRIEHLRTNILAELGLSGMPTPPENVSYPTDEELDQDVLQQYYEMVNATYVSETAADLNKCTSEEFFAKAINSFVGELSEGEFVFCL